MNRHHDPNDPWQPNDWARYYAVEHGWCVIPLRSRSKAPLVDSSLGLTRGHRDATTDPLAIDAIWSKHPRAGVAITTGDESGLVVLDVDPRNGGEEGLINLEDQVGRLELGPVSLTGGGGSHTFYSHPGHKVRCSNNVGGHRGVDLKANGGYVVAPPSTHPNGLAYSWNPLMHLFTTQVPRLPAALSRIGETPNSVCARAYTAKPWDESMPLSAAPLIVRSPKIYARFKRSTVGLNDQSPSGVDYSLACQLASAGLDAVSIEGAVRKGRSMTGLPERGAPYFSSTVGKAIALAAGDQGRQS